MNLPVNSNDLPMVLSNDQLELVKRTIAKGATDDELKLFLYRCQKLQLDPLKSGEIHFIKYGNGPGTIVVGIDGFRIVAHRSGKLAGIKRGVNHDSNGKLVSAWAEVFRTDWTHPAREEVPLKEYSTGKGPWARLEETMLKKCAESAALRMAFPNDLGGTYIQEEMDQAEVRHQETPARVPQPLAGTPNTSQLEIAEQQMIDGIIPFGKYARQRCEDIDFATLQKYVIRLDQAEEKQALTWDQEVTRNFIARYLTKQEQGAAS